MNRLDPFYPQNRIHPLGYWQGCQPSCKHGLSGESSGWPGKSTACFPSCQWGRSPEACSTFCQKILSTWSSSNVACGLLSRCPTSGHYAHNFKTVPLHLGNFLIAGRRRWFPLRSKSLACSQSLLRPVSNVQYVSKLTECAVFDQTHAHLTSHGLYPPFQSAYRKCHSTETALLKLQKDILINLDSQRFTLLVLLDLSAAFETVDHGVLLNRLSTSFRVKGLALQWFTSYLLNRSQRVSFDQNLS